MLHLLEKKLTFKPTRDDHGGLANVRHERVSFGEEFGLSLDGIFIKHPSDTVVLFTHGNKHNITQFRDHYDLFNSLGVSFFTFDYPGYGRSAGSPSEEGAYARARAAYSHLQHRLGYQPSHIVAYGCSMGGGVAIDLAQHSPVAGVITEGTFTNSWEMAKHLYPYLPIWPLLPKRFNNIEKISSIKAPKLLIHGESDRTVPVSMASALYHAAAAPTELVLIPGGGHIDCLTVGGEPLKGKIRSFLEMVSAP